MAKSVKLMLTETVDELGIVGDIVNVRLGYARNFLLPRGFATTPSDDALAELAERRKAASAKRDLERTERSSVIDRLADYELVMERACNDMGVLYGGVTQSDIATALVAAGFGVRTRDVRLSHAIKRVDTYDIPIKFASDLETTLKLSVTPDREIEEDERVEMEFDDEGELVMPTPRPAREPAPAAETPAEAPAAAE